ncbi:uroporphyrin-III C-methyltransferase [Dimargaris verticillata]|uniref:precorrin-2 dehydrogenase n=1 Tax=Dimargaris verticillata TaxID=2761393 RepID=A0A9W8AWR7_9FUNG|nr:uroporphyrin-III C-methyltransferase [Dimargaris verticillata]
MVSQPPTNAALPFEPLPKDTLAKYALDRTDLSFMVAYQLAHRNVLIIGSNAVAASRVRQALACGAIVTVIAPWQDQHPFDPELRAFIQTGQVHWHNRTWSPHDLCAQCQSTHADGVTHTTWSLVMVALDSQVPFSTDAAEHRVSQLTHYTSDCNHQVPPSLNAWTDSEHIAYFCRQRGIPINVADVNPLCDFYFMSSFHDGPLQVAVSTNGHAPKLANRIRRHLQASLPVRTGDAVTKIGRLRQWIKAADARHAVVDQPSSVSPRASEVFGEAQSQRRMKWVAQLCEYWPIELLAGLTDDQIKALLDEYQSHHGDQPPPQPPTNQLSATNLLDFSQPKALEQMNAVLPLTPPPSSPPLAAAHLPNSAATGFDKGEPVVQDWCGNQALRGRRGQLYLVGAGLGTPEHLTVAAYQAIRTADVILSDKLIPAGILSLVQTSPSTPCRCVSTGPTNASNGEPLIPVACTCPEAATRPQILHVARKFPGHADQAQQEFNQLGEQYLARGLTVVRLKAGDPFIYGRGGEEYLYFKERGYTPTVLPGLSSAVAGPLLAAIPLTHRDCADQIVVATGTTRDRGPMSDLPPFHPKRTTVLLMAVHRLETVVKALLSTVTSATTVNLGYPATCPVAIVEKAGFPDQRVIRGTLATIVEDVKRAGGSSPPAMCVVGNVVNLLETDPIAFAATKQVRFASSPPAMVTTASSDKVLPRDGAKALLAQGSQQRTTALSF